MALQVNTSSVAAPASQSAGAALDVTAMEAKTVSLEGVFVGTYQVQISCDAANPPAAASWTNVGSALTSAGNVFVQQPAMWVRINCTAYTSGTPVGRCAGLTSFA